MVLVVFLATYMRLQGVYTSNKSAEVSHRVQINIKPKRTWFERLCCLPAKKRSSSRSSTVQTSSNNSSNSSTRQTPQTPTTAEPLN